MKKFMFRLFAYFVDIILVSILLFGISFIPNPYNNKANEYGEIASKLYEEYEGYAKNITKILEDKKIEESELDFEVPEKYKVIELEKKEYSDDDINNLNKKIIDIYQDNAIEPATMRQRYSVPASIISIIVLVLYFGVLQYFLNGQTLGKKLFKLKVISSEDKEKKVSLINYILRSLLISASIFTVANSIMCFALDMNAYAYAYNYLFDLQTIYYGVFAMVLLFTEDNKSVHDYLLKTNVELTSNLS